MSNEAEELCNQGLELMSRHEWAEAEEKMSRAVWEDSYSPELWYNLGKCRFHQDNYTGAINALGKAIAARSSVPSEDGIEFPVRGIKYPEAAALLGSCYYALLDMYNARNMFSSALHPDNPPDFNRECKTAEAHSILAAGNYSDWGWSSYQQRLKEPDTWNGTQSLVGKTLLVKAEGGLGDQIFFARYDRMLKNLGAGYVEWEVDEPLKGYFGWSLEIDTVPRGEEVEHDYMVHAGSLPYIFGTKAGTIPLLGGRYGLVDEPRRIGIAYSGNPLHPDDHHRSIPLVEFAPLLSLKKHFYLVQKDVRYADRPHFAGIIEEKFDDVQEIAAVVDELDLVITVDTMTAHLAGAEGIPTWLLLPYAPDWRWGLEGEKTPWYSSVRIFRQGPDRQWGPVIQRVVEELKRHDST